MIMRAVGVLCRLIGIALSSMLRIPSDMVETTMNTYPALAAVCMVAARLEGHLKHLLVQFRSFCLLQFHRRYYPVCVKR